MDIAIPIALELIFYDCSFTHVHQKSEPHFSRSKAELVLLEISLVRTGINNFVADFNTYTLNVGCSQVICGRISF